MPNETSKDLVLVMTSITDTTGGTKVKFEEVGWSGKPFLKQGADTKK